jgi:radical SAM protein with 4Fe4S-binding SPASM domain
MQAEAHFVAPSWLALSQDEKLELVDFDSGDRLTFNGVLRESVLSERPGEDPRLAAMAALDATLARLREHLVRTPATPLNRASLMRGTGFRHLFVELTARCNEQCVHCYAESSPERDEALEWEQIESVLRDAHALGFSCAQLTGGDPLVSPHCLRAAKLIFFNDTATTEIYTNGLALKGELYEGLRELDAKFAFSFYSHDAETHDAITRTPGSQERTLRAIERCIGDGLSARVGVVVVGPNADHVPQTIERLREAGVPGQAIAVDWQRSVGRGEYTTPQSVNMPTDIDPNAGHGRAPSPQMEGRIAVSYDGNVYPCIFSRSISLGNVRSASLRQVLEAPISLQFEQHTLEDALTRWQPQLACWQCRARAALLAPMPPLVALMKGKA